ncbi:MAG TPA: PEGA domain-containing protein [Vicinamibacterales bacterium]|nr:PEGA domain-containing protein [Vicinamibacterales bacterium]
MEPATAHAGAPAPNSFTDGLGVRRRTTDPARHEPIELLCLRGDLTAVPSFEFALRERVSHLAGFRRACFGGIRSVERLKSPPSALVLVSDVTAGVRLSELLTFAERADVPLDIDAALCLLRQIVPAVATLHEQAPDVAHGAIAPERIIVTPNARIVMVEHVLGAALSELQYSREKYWKDLRVAIPGATGPIAFNHRSDVTQLGAVALALIVGRPLGDDELPARLGEVVASSWAISARGGLEPLPAGLRAWLMRALQLDPRESFESAIDAHEDLENVLGDSDYMAAPASLEAFLGHYRAETGAHDTWSAERHGDPVRQVEPTPAPRPVEAVVPPAASRPRPTEVKPAAAIPASTQPVPTATPALGVHDSHPGAAPVKPALGVHDSHPGAAPVKPTLGVHDSHPGAAPVKAEPYATTEKTPIYVPPAVDKTPIYVPPPAVEKTTAPAAAAEKSPLLEKTPIYVPPAAEKTPTYVPPVVDRTPVHGAAVTERTSSYVGSSFAAAATSRAFDQKPFDQPPVDQRLFDQRPADQKAFDPKPVDQKPIEHKAVEQKVADVKPADHKPVDYKPIDYKPIDYKPAAPAPGASRVAMSTFDLSTPSDEPAVEAHGGSRKKWWPAVAAVAVLALAGVAVPSVRKLVTPTPAATEGTLNVATNPPGAHLFVDGVERGVTPLTVALKPGPHSLEIRGDGEPRLMPVTITAGAQVFQSLDLPKAAAAVGQLLVRTEPAGARVTVDGVGRGAAPVTVAALTPGEHTVVVESDLGTVKQTVTVEAGNTASLTVPLGGGEGAPVSGWLTLAAPAELQIFENKRLIGTSQTDRVMVSAGRHEFELVNEAIGYRAVRTVQVAAGKVTPIKVDFPKGSMALNALPWAEVWVDGEKVGETPIGNLQVTIGPHDIVFRNPELGEQRHKAIVTLSAPARVSVDLRKK